MIPGSFFLTPTAGPVGFGIALGELLAGSPSRWTHAGIVLNDAGDVVEAQARGARLANLSEYPVRIISDAPVQQWMADYGFADDNTRASYEYSIRSRIVTEARKLVGTPYSFLDYFALAALHLHLPNKWVRQRVAHSGSMICSQLVDAVYERCGIHLFKDGRLPGDVMPADLANYALV